MSMMHGFSTKNPTHPGGFVKSEIIEALGLSVTDAATVLGVTRPALSALLNERAHLSSEMALRIEKAFGVSMDRLMRMQNSFDITESRKREGDIKVAPLHGQAPRSAAGSHLTNATTAIKWGLSRNGPENLNKDY